MQVLKFGGSSVANAENIQKVIQIISKAVQKDSTIVVVSAMGGVTDALLESGLRASEGDDGYISLIKDIEQRHIYAVKELIPATNQSAVLSKVVKLCQKAGEIANGVFLLKELSPSTRDRLAGYGEKLSSTLLSIALKEKGITNVWKDAADLIVTDDQFGNARVLKNETHLNIRNYFTGEPAPLYILPGFVAATRDGRPTTLGRGGSDYTAAIIAGALKADVLELWKDVSGMMTADPRYVTNSRIIRHISYEEAMELSHFGAKVVYPPTIQPARENKIPVLVKNTFRSDDEGTLIDDKALPNGNMIRGITSIGNIALISLEGSGMVGVPGFSRRLFEALSSENINVILITQGSSEHSICVAIEKSAAQKAAAAVNKAFSTEISSGRIDPLKIEENLSIIAVVGDKMKSMPGTSGKMFSTLGRNGINVRAIAQGSSERNISAVISDRDVRKAINAIHEEFFETVYKQVHLFIAGTGNVGSRLISQLAQQEEFLMEKLRLKVKVVGISNSRKMYFNEDGISLNNWKPILEENGEKSDVTAFVKGIISRNLRNAVFADVTANETVARVYPELLMNSIAVVACNKIACASEYGYYEKLKRLSRDYNAPFMFETNVGAGLPVIGTLNDLIRSGDRIRRIEAVLSGTLNFVFNHYNGKRKFAEVVWQAKTEGYTEPDPRLDLAGTDVMRKIMILAREAGEKLNMDDIVNNSFMPESCMQGNLESFFLEMEKHEDHFRSLYEDAHSKGCKLKFVAVYENGKASVGLKEVPPHHDFHHLYGKDNVVAFYSDRYPDLPLTVKGAGAGAEVTASGVFADIIRAVKF